MANTPLLPFVTPGESLGFVAVLKERGLWPPRLDRPNDGDHPGPTATPFLVIPTTISPPDGGVRPQPNSKALHSQGIWLEDQAGHVVSAPVVGGHYRIKCRIQNLGAFAAYGGMADFFINTPSAFTTAAGTSATLPAIGHTGFSIIPSQEVVITCPTTWVPATDQDLASSIVVHAYDLFADNLSSRFDARNDRHVGRHDLTPDLYVRDWTDSAAVHDDGIEPSARSVFYRTSDVWNRRTSGPTPFVNDQPENEDAQQGSGPAGDNFVHARISRNDASIEQTFNAHFLVAEFGTGSPFIDCSNAPDPTVTLLVGETSKVVSLPWRLHPSSSTHLCLAVQVDSAGDPFAPPGLLGYTPGWPTTDMMVINDNNKAQRNIGVWDGIAGIEGTHIAVVFNAAYATRDVTLVMGGSRSAVTKLRNARVTVLPSRVATAFRPGATVVLPSMLPGERRWCAFSYDSVAFAGPDDLLSVSFGEVVGSKVVNGFGFDLRSATHARMVQRLIAFQSAVFYRLYEGMGVDGAREGLAMCTRLVETRADLPAYLSAVPALARTLAESVKRMSANYGGIEDVFGLDVSLRSLEGMADRRGDGALALHNRVLYQVDALQTMATKSRGDLADTLFTVRLQRHVYQAGALSSGRFDELRSMSNRFIDGHGREDAGGDRYAALVRASSRFFEATASVVNKGPVTRRYTELIDSLSRGPEAIQKAHLNFLNAVAMSLQDN